MYKELRKCHAIINAMWLKLYLCAVS